MEIIETPIFTRQIQDLLGDDEYLKLQAALMLRPDLGVVIPGSGGIRKLPVDGSWTWEARGVTGDLLLGGELRTDLHAHRLSEE